MFCDFAWKMGLSGGKYVLGSCFMPYLTAMMRSDVECRSGDEQKDAPLGLHGVALEVGNPLGMHFILSV